MSRYRYDERDDEFNETRRGQVRSFAEQQFDEGQRRRYDREHTSEGEQQFDYGTHPKGENSRLWCESQSDAPQNAQSDTRRDDDSRAVSDRATARRSGANPYPQDYMRGRAEYEAVRNMTDAERRRDYSSTRFDRDAQDVARDDKVIDEGERATTAMGGASRSHVRCRDIMTRDVTVAMRETTLQQVAALMRDEDTGVIPVVEIVEETDDNQNVPPILQQQAQAKTRDSITNGKLIGLITDRDIVVRAIAEGKDAMQTRVEEIMTSEVYTAEPNDRVIDVIRKMGDKQVRRIPVVDRDGNLRGIISMADVALETESDRELAHALEEISSGAGFWSKVF